MKPKAKILIVEDERIAAEDLKKTLEHLGYSVTSVVSSGKKAIKAANTDKPHLILMDIKIMGDMDGIEAAKHIRTRFDIPVVYITALSDASTLERSKLTEPFGYIHKPIEEKDLLTTVEMALYRYKMERKLKESEEKFRLMAETSIDIIFQTDLAGVITYCSQSAEKYSGFTAEELIGTSFKEYFSPEDIKKMMEAFGKVASGDSVEHFETNIIRKDRSVAVLEFNMVPIHRDGQVIGVQGVARDLTERKKAAQAMQEERDKAKKYLDVAGIMFVIIDADQRVKLINQKGCEILGYREKDIVGKSWFDNFIPSRIRGEVKEVFKKFISGHVELAEYHENPVLTRSGQERIIAWHNTLLHDERGKIVGTVSSGEDVTKRRLAEQKFRESEEKYRNIVELAPDVILTLDLKGRITSCNEAITGISGYSPDEILGKHFSKLPYLRKADRPKYIKIFASLLRGKVPKPFEVSWIHKNGTAGWAEIHANLMKIDGKTSGIQVIGRDTTERKRAEEELIRLSNAVKISTDSIVISDVKGNILDVNEATLKMYGTDKKEGLIGKSSFELIDPEDRERALEGMEEVLEKGFVKNQEYQVIARDGRKIPVELSSSLIRDPDGKPVGYVGISRDITERKKAELEKEKLQAQLIHSEKMAGIGTLTSGIAHEFNNLLQIIKGHSEFAKQSERQEDVEEAFDTVISNVDKAAKIIKDLLAFSSREATEKELIDITEPIESVLSMTEEQLEKQNIEVVRKYRRIPKIEVNKAEMLQVFMNMVTNAWDVMSPHGGRLEIDVRKVDENVDVSFRDTGRGIKKENISRVFEPFYTTKGAIGGSEIPGTGLGLSVSFGIIRRHGGSIGVKSRVGRGTTFTVKLPIKKARIRVKREEYEKKRRERKLNPLNILVVDDEEEICTMFTKWLIHEGHRGESTLTGKKALNLVKKRHFDTVFLDIVIPGLPAINVLEKIKGISPETKVIVMTGKLMDKNLKSELQRKGASGFLKKPFKMEDIKEVLPS